MGSAAADLFLNHASSLGLTVDPSFQSGARTSAARLWLVHRGGAPDCLCTAANAAGNSFRVFCFFWRGAAPWETPTRLPAAVCKHELAPGIHARSDPQVCRRELLRGLWVRALSEGCPCSTRDPLRGPTARAHTCSAASLVARRGSAPGEQWACVVRPSCAARGTCPWTLRVADASAGVGLLAGHPRGAGSAPRGQGVPHQSRRPEEAVRFATLSGVRGPSGLEPACLGPPPAAHVRRDRRFARTLRLAHRGDRLLLLAEFPGRLRW